MQAQAERWTALDVFRGLVIFLMLPVNAAMDFERIPAWFKHAPALGLTMPDLIMPAFLVALGLSSSLSLRRRLAAKGALKTWGHALIRYALLFAFGTIGFFMVWKQKNWEILQMLGLTGALAFPFLFLKPQWRLTAAAALLVAVEALRPLFFEASYRAWYDSGIGGPAGTFALAALPIAASALGEYLAPQSWKRRALSSAIVGVAAFGLGLLLSLISPITKHLLSPSYLLLTFGTALLALAAAELLVASLRREPPLIAALGRNPLFAYMAGGILTLCIRGFLPDAASAAFAWASSLLVLALIITATAIMDSRRIWIKL